MVVLLYAVEVEVLDNLQTPDREVLTEAARAHRARAEALRAAGRGEAAEADLKKADKLEADSRAVTDARSKGKDSPGTEKGEGGGTRVQAAKPPSPPGGGQPAGARLGEPSPAGTGEVVFINGWTSAVTVLVEGVPYRVPPGEEKRVSRAPGSFTYEVLEAGHKATRNLAAGQVFRVQINAP